MGGQVQSVGGDKANSEASTQLQASAFDPFRSIGDESELMEDAAQAWANISSNPSCGISLGTDAKSRFYGTMAGPQVEDELRRQATVLKGLMRDVSIVKDSVWHLEEDRPQLRASEHGGVKHIQEDGQNAETLADVAQRTTALSDALDTLKKGDADKTNRIADLGIQVNQIAAHLNSQVPEALAIVQKRLEALEEIARKTTSSERMDSVEAQMATLVREDKLAETSWAATIRSQHDDLSRKLADVEEGFSKTLQAKHDELLVQLTTLQSSFSHEDQVELHGCVRTLESLEARVEGFERLLPEYTCDVFMPGDQEEMAVDEAAQRVLAEMNIVNDVDEIARRLVCRLGGEASREECRSSPDQRFDYDGSTSQRVNWDG